MNYPLKQMTNISEKIYFFRMSKKKEKTQIHSIGLFQNKNQMKQSLYYSAKNFQINTVVS